MELGLLAVSLVICSICLKASHCRELHGTRTVSCVIKDLYLLLARIALQGTAWN
jgi:hypothetical protein